jgi:hypothetical protein
VKRHANDIDPQLETLLERGRIIPRVPDVVRARALARARAHAAAATATVASRVVAPAPATPARGRAWRTALAASVTLIVAAAGAAAALHGRALRHPEPAPLASPPALSSEHGSLAELPTRPTLAPETISVAKPRHGARSATARESYAAELELLHSAQAAHATGNFIGALALVAEHGRRFPNGRLSEEREALRIRSLVGAGHADEARRTFVVFAHRFPRSVFLTRLQETANGAH